MNQSTDELVKKLRKESTEYKNRAKKIAEFLTSGQRVWQYQYDMLRYQREMLITLANTVDLRIKDIEQNEGLTL